MATSQTTLLEDIAPDRRLPPKRYPYIGLALIGGFVLLTLNGMGGPHATWRELQRLSSDAPEAPLEQEALQLSPTLAPKVAQRFRAAQALFRTFRCAPEHAFLKDMQACQKEIKATADRLDEIVAALHMEEAAQQDSGVFRLTNQIDEVAAKAQAYAEYPLNERSTRKVIPEAVSLEEEGQRLADLIERSVPATPEPEAAVVPAQAALTVDAGPAAEALAPDASVTPTIAEVVAAAAPDSGPTAAVGIADVIAAADQGSEDGGVVEVNPGPSLARQLVKPLHDALENLENVHHAQNLAADAAWRARTRLDAMPPILRKYQAASRSAETAAAATAFSESVDRARGRLLHAAAELERAVTASLDQFEGTSPFKAADDALERARADVAAVDAKVDSAP